MNCSLAFSARKELVVGIEIFEGIYSHPGLRTPAGVSVERLQLLKHPIGTFISTEVGKLQKKVDSLSWPHSEFKSRELAFDDNPHDPSVPRTNSCTMYRSYRRSR